MTQSPRQSGGTGSVTHGPPPPTAAGESDATIVTAGGQSLPVSGTELGPGGRAPAAQGGGFLARYLAEYVFR